MELVSCPSSLKNLLLYSPSCSLTCLQTNTCLTTLKLSVPESCWDIYIRFVLGILENNTSLRFLFLYTFDVTDDFDMPYLRSIVSALYENKSLHSMSVILRGSPLYFYVASEFMNAFFRELTRDSRISWYPEEQILLNFKGADLLGPSPNSSPSLSSSSSSSSRSSPTL